MQVHAPTAPHPTGLDAGFLGPILYGASSGWWLVQVLQQHGPSWEALGPILLGVGAILHGRANSAPAAGGDPGAVGYHGWRHRRGCRGPHLRTPAGAWR